MLFPRYLLRIETLGFAPTGAGKFARWALLAGLILGCAAGCTAGRKASENASDGRLHRLGTHRFPVTTHSAEARGSFDKALTLAYAFSHRAAEEEFRRAAQSDPACALAWWGVALVNGPHINFPIVPPDKARTAADALNRAVALAPQSSPLEQGLIRALQARYRDPQPEDRSPLDLAYAEAMRAAWRQFPANADVGTLFAESLMDLHPWDLWKLDGSPQPWTPEIVATLEQVLKLDPKHPGALHLYIHAVEASNTPQRAIAAANRLGPLVPDASHLVHMPSHIYARVGRWADAATSNRRAMDADAIYRTTFPQVGFYAMYMAHNTHFLAFTSMMRGRSEETVTLARRMVASIPEEFLRDYAPIADGFMIFTSEALMRFGRWEEILREPAPRPGLPLAKALWHFTRAIALTALNRGEEARVEAAAFREASAAVPKEWTFGNNSAADLLAIAAKVLEGEMAAQSGRFDEAIASLRAGVALEAAIRYDEPPDWLQPVRHTLGAVLLRAGRFAEAEEVYRADLKQYPENGWSLFGLGRALRKQGRDAEASRVERRFKKAWSDSDIHLKSTCLCQPGV